MDKALLKQFLEVPINKRDLRGTEATLKFLKLNTQAQQREAVVQGRSLSPYRLRYITFFP
ncbi:MAG: hypothetical protein LBJ00_06050 [Planctomycetaceae bacterium]|jgi:hypothetical protein|nr:hypothetical protein [Planctomycetaceae bacterium]